MKYILLLPLVLTLTACGGKDSSAPAAATTQATTPANSASDSLAQVTTAEGQLESAGCYLQDRGDSSRRGPQQVRIDCDRVPAFFDSLRDAQRALRSYREAIIAASNGSLNDADRALLGEKRFAAEQAAEQIRQRIEQLGRRPDNGT